MGLIYRVTNLNNGKSYIGLTSMSLPDRKNSHYSNARKGTKTAFANALRKYPRDDFYWEVIEDGIDRPRLPEREQMWIRLLKTKADQWGYNMTDGGEGALNPTEEARKRVSDATAEVWKRDGHRERMSRAHIGYAWTKETREKMAPIMQANAEKRKREGYRPSRESVERMKATKKASLEERKRLGIKQERSIDWRKKTANSIRLVWAGRKIAKENGFALNSYAEGLVEI